MPRRVPTYKPKGLPAPARLYERATPRREDKAFYSSRPWIAIRDLVRAEEPLCRACLARGEISPTEAIDHVLDRKDRPDLALDRDNLQGLCKRCHNSKRGLR